MYFRAFTLGVKSEKFIEKAGFRVNSYKNVKTFHGLDEEGTIRRPKDYCYDGSVWKEIEVSDFSERVILLCRLPILSFAKLWHLYFNGVKEDSFGALNVLVNQYVSEMICAVQSTTEEQKSDKTYRKKITKLKTNPIITSCSRGKEIVSSIDALDFDI